MKKAGYANELFSFNVPDEFAKVIKEVGVDFVSTTNNYWLDRGIEGLKRIIQVLARIRLDHDGTQTNTDEITMPFVVPVDTIRLAIIPFIYGTNYGSNHQALPEQSYVDLLHASNRKL